VKHTRKLIDLFEGSTGSERNQGKHWYTDARGYLQAMADHHKESLKVTAGIAAVLSPLENWKTNLNMTNMVLRGKRVRGLKKNISKANMIKKTQRVLPNLRGPKVRSFFLNLIGNESEITIDTLMIRAYHGSTQKNNLTKPQRLDLEAQVHMISRTHGLTPAQAQATIWIAYHRVYKSNFPGCVSLLKIF